MGGLLSLKKETGDRGGLLLSLGGFVIRIRILMYPACILYPLKDTRILMYSLMYLKRILRALFSAHRTQTHAPGSNPFPNTWTAKKFSASMSMRAEPRCTSEPDSTCLLIKYMRGANGKWRADHAQHRIAGSSGCQIVGAISTHLSTHLP